MTDVEALAEFVRTHISDDARTAEGAIGPLGGRWRAEGGKVEVATDALTADTFQRTVCFPEGSPTDEEALHIARNDPARVLRDAEARTEIVAACVAYIETYQKLDPPAADDAEGMRVYHRLGGAATVGQQILQLLAQRYADLGGYNPK